MSFPRQLARTRRFTLGIPRSFTIVDEGGGVLFLRSPSGSDPKTALWLAMRTDQGGLQERCLVDPTDLKVDEDDLPPEERARRERAREQASGIVEYAADDRGELIAFAYGGRLFTHHRPSATTVEHPSAGAVFDPRPSPDGSRVAYVSGSGLHVLELPGGPTQAGVTRPLLVEDGIIWGRAEFVAAEEMRRTRGYWWAPDSTRMAVARVDESAVHTWHISDPADPATAPTEHRYPAAGTANADVRVAVIQLDARRINIDWDRDTYPYLTRVGWDLDPAGKDRLIVQVQTRDQRRVTILRADPETGRSQVIHEIADDAWVELVVGSPTWSGSRLVTVEDRERFGPVGSRVVALDGETITPADLQVRSVVGATDDEVVVTASADDPTSIGLYRVSEAGIVAVGETDGVASGTAAFGTVVSVHASLVHATPEVQVRWAEHLGGGQATIEVLAEAPVVVVSPRWLTLGERGLRAALLMPTDDRGTTRLPVLLDPYGGPHAQRVVRSQVAMATSQWFADQGFAVLVVDGRGSPGRGPRWEREVATDLVSAPLHDQFAGLEAAAALEPRLDLDRVAVRGWSFGGYLAAAAALREPQRVRAAIAGAPVTDWGLYDTHYTERYLSTPKEAPEAYEISNLVDADGHLGRAQPWTNDDTPSLLIIHGLADDNVVAAHSLRLSAALFADGRDHRFLPLAGVTHMTPQETITERLLRLQVRFLKQAVGEG